MSYLKNLNEDFEEMKSVLDSRFGDLSIPDEVLNDFMAFHKSLVIYRDLFSDISEQLPLGAARAFQLSIVDFLDFIWLLHLGRYKASMAALRTGMDVFSRGAIRTLPSIVESDSFSQNVQKTMKTIRESNEQTMQFGSTRKLHKRYIEDSFTAPLVNLYGELSDSIHGKETIVFDLPDYINDVLDADKNYDEEALKEVIVLAKEVINLLLQVFIILNFRSLNTYSNLYKLDIVISIQEDKLKKYTYDFLKDIEF